MTERAEEGGGLMSFLHTNNSPRVLTQDDIRKAMEMAAEVDRKASEDRARRIESLVNLRLDLDVASRREQVLITLAYEGHIFHPADFEELKRAVERLRRDR